MANDEKTTYLNQLKKMSIQIGELLNEEKWKEANEFQKQFKAFLGNQPDDLTRGEMERYHIEDIQNELGRLNYAYREMAKFTGALRKKGDKFLDFANVK